MFYTIPRARQPPAFQQRFVSITNTRSGGAEFSILQSLQNGSVSSSFQNGKGVLELFYQLREIRTYSV